MNYQEAIEYLEGLAVFGIKLGLKRIERLLELLDEPQEKYRTVHVTGTNGKGSVSAMLTSIVMEAGLRTGLYTSPHLESYRERFQVDGQMISTDDFAALMEIIKGASERMAAEGDEPPTQFEVLTALGFLYFAEKKVDYAIVEVGLGGLLDSTNVIIPEVSVITNVTMEHADRCGGTLEGIAHHKAGIIKEGIPVVTGAAGLPLEIIRQTAEEKNTDVFVIGDDFKSELVKTVGSVQELEFTSVIMGINKGGYKLPLLGKHQIENSSLAIMAAELLHNNDERIAAENILRSLGMVNWPGRFELINYPGKKIVVDGAHNPAGVEALRESLDFYYPDEKRVFLLGVLKDKDYGSMLRSLLRLEDYVVLTTPDSDRAEDPDMVAFQVHTREIISEPDREAALGKALDLAGDDKLLCVTGSLYLIGKIRRLLIDKARE